MRSAPEPQSSVDGYTQALASLLRAVRADSRRLLILTGQRRGEIAGLQRSWIDDSAIMVPSGFTKNKREHSIPLGEQTASLIDAIPDLGTDLLFSARGTPERPSNCWSKAKRSFDRDIDVTDYTFHDLRRTFTTKLAALGTPIHVTERILNLVSGTVGGVVAVYNRRSYMGEMRDAMAPYEAHLANLVTD